MFPDAAFSHGHALAVAEALAGRVSAGSAKVADHHADVADRHQRFRNDLDRGEPTVEEVGAVGERIVLSAAAAPGAEKGFRILIVIVIVRIVTIVADGGSDDLSRRQRGAILNRDDADVVLSQGALGLEGILHFACGNGAGGTGSRPSLAGFALARFFRLLPT